MDVKAFGKLSLTRNVVPKWHTARLLTASSAFLPGRLRFEVGPD
jgi:hypothetical protein